MAQNNYNDEKRNADELLAKLSIPKMRNKTAIVEQIILVSIIESKAITLYPFCGTNE